MKNRWKSEGHSHVSLSSIIWLTVMVAAMAACGHNADRDQTEDPSISSQTSFLGDSGTPAGIWTDQSGTVQFQLWAGGWVRSGSNGRADATVEVESGYVIVGGGAEIDTAGSGNPGALLTASYPETVLRWKASAKDHVYPHSYQLRAWAIGMKLTGVSQASLLNEMHIVPQTSPSSNAPSAAATLPMGDILVGGGARTTYPGAGLLLTRSTANLPRTWSATAKDHGIADTGTVTAYAIGVKRCPSNFGGRCLSSTNFTAVGTAGTGYKVASASATLPWAMSCIGGAGIQSAPGRLLNTLRPEATAQGAATIWTKDHQFLHNGATTAQVIGVRRD